ncbi:cellulase family glycosylhydrolase [Paractinoplanes ferrugineus]|uniref:cellulase family glycosylhydrolase n=1 Tax=Paractinoplanes ferrugineus TaxID=113564 RepID=UPI001940E9C8|nr:cellulase family glycosylhydrolase [Actinoplanes ferrugineus]
MVLNFVIDNSRATGPATRSLKLGVSYGDRLVWMSDAELAAALDDAVTLGTGWIRADLSWNNIQHEGPSVRKWKLFDRVVAAARERHLKILPVLAYTPPWARPANCDSPSCGPARPAEFAAFAREAATRYAAKGIHTWEIWNEPNLATFWLPKPAPAEYNALLQATAKAIRKVDSAAKLVLGGLASLSTRDHNIAQSEFLDQVSALGGNRVVDAIGYHPYTYPYLCSARTTFRTPWEWMDHGPGSLRGVLRAHGTAEMPIWVTEIGAPTGGPGGVSDGTLASIKSGTTHVTEHRQAQIAADAVRTAAADPNVAALVWYADRDPSTDRSSNENFYGLRRADGSAKPAFAAFRAAISGLRAERP